MPTISVQTFQLQKYRARQTGVEQAVHELLTPHIDRPKCLIFVRNDATRPQAPRKEWKIALPSPILHPFLGCKWQVSNITQSADGREGAV